MKIKLTTIAILLLPCIGLAQVPELKKTSDLARVKLNKEVATSVNPILYVNPFIGTGGHGHTFPGPVVPFGMVQLGPDTRPEGWDGCGGYHYSDSIIYGFSHTHLSGTGIPDYSDVLIVPQMGKPNTIPAYKKENGFGAKFKHADEVAQPGFYSVKLENGISVKLTTSERVGIHSYQFPKNKKKKYILIDLGYRDRVIETEAKKVGNRIVGKRISEAWAKEQHLYFALEASQPIVKTKWETDKKTGHYVMILEFSSKTTQVDLHVGISGTDEEGAQTNLNEETKEFKWDFTKYQLAASNRWLTELNTIQVQATDKEVLTNFYTALYHTFVHPSLWTDCDGRYRTYNQEIAHSEIPLFSVFSIWDTYRGANPLYTITQPEKSRQFIESYRLQYKQTGLLPMWTLSNNETDCMIGYHAASVIADAGAKGIRLNEPEELLAAMIATSTAKRYAREQYGVQGFISANTEAESVSKTLEYAFDDWCIAQFAKQLGNTTVQKEYELRAASWMNSYNPESGFFQARKGGIWLPNFKPEEVNHHYTEANAWQYSLAAPQHIDALIQLKGGKQSALRFMDSLFTGKSEMSGRVQSDITGLIGQYAHGNEPSHHMAYTYNYLGRPDKTQFYINKIQSEQYSNSPDGLSGNEDCGQMSAWFVLNAMGFYPFSPGNTHYAIGRPLMDRLALKMGEKTFIVQTVNNAPNHPYIQSMTWNGQPYSKLYITHDMLVAGGVFEFTMSEFPVKVMFESDHSDLVTTDFVPVPYIYSDKTTFSDKTEVSFDKLPFETGMIYYSIDGGKFEPFTAKDKNIQLNRTATVSAKVVREVNDKRIESAVVSNVFTKFIKELNIELETEYANQYNGGGNQALVDGQRGTEEYRGTEWQGFSGKDVVAKIELIQPREISKISIEGLQDTRSWIFFPKAAVVYVSEDGINYTKITEVKNTVISDRESAVTIGQLVVEFAPVHAKFVKLVVENYGVCPDWHLGSGNPTWIFLDEIVIY